MNRSRDYYRKMRKKHIKRKKEIATYAMVSYEHDGMYSKGKLHLSNAPYRSKTNNKSWKKRCVHGNFAPNHNWKPADKRKINSMDDKEKSMYEAAVFARYNEEDNYLWETAVVADVYVDGIPLDGNYFDRLLRLL